MKAGMKGQCDTSHMAYHIKETHGGRESEAKFVMKKVKSYPSTFLRILAECIRIKYRSREKGISVLNQKSGDFGSYTLPRLSVGGHDQEMEPRAPAQGNMPGDERSESRKCASSAGKAKVKFKKKIYRVSKKKCPYVLNCHNSIKIGTRNKSRVSFEILRNSSC